MMAAAAHHDLLDYFWLFGPSCALIVATHDPGRKFSYPYRTLFLQEMIKRHVLAPTMLAELLAS